MTTLRGYDAAVFRADMKFVDENLHNNKLNLTKKFIIERNNGNVVLTPNPSYNKEESRVKRWEREQVRAAYIINYLKEHYPDKSYAERFEKNNEWSKPLMFPTDESKHCPCLTEDGRHCNLKRSGTGCYTCCFVCFSPSLCKWTNCPILPEDRRPKK